MPKDEQPIKSPYFSTEDAKNYLSVLQQQDNSELFLNKDSHSLRGMKSAGVDLNTLENLVESLNGSDRTRSARPNRDCGLCL